MEIRKIRTEERDQALGLMKDAFDPSYGSIFFLNEDQTLVAVEDGEVIAGCNSDVFTLPNGKRIGYIGWLYTGEKARGKGLASKLAEKMTEHLEEEEKCDEVLVIIEGDNPSSFKIFADRFRIMPLTMQLRTFGSGIFRVWKRSSHFLDTGYFIWHRGKGLSPDDANWKNFFLNMAFNVLLISFFLSLRHRATPWNIALPSLFLVLRALMLKISMGWNRTTFLPWDTYPGMALLSALLFPFYVPDVLGVYMKGHGWSMKENAGRLSGAAMITVMFELVWFVLTADLTVVLPVLIADTVLAFYPFCGFQASRLKRTGGRRFRWISMVTLTAATAVIIMRHAI